MGNIFGGGKKKDPQIPPPRTDNAGMSIRLHHGTGDPEPREVEALQVLQAYVRPPFFPTDRDILIRAVTWEEGKQFHISRGNPASNWPKSRTGYAYPPRPDLGHVPQIHLVINGLNKDERIHLALHEWSHMIWHWLLTDQEWGQAGVYGTDDKRGSYEAFADAFADWLRGKSINTKWRSLFEKIEARLKTEGQAARRG